MKKLYLNNKLKTHNFVEVYRAWNYSPNSILSFETLLILPKLPKTLRNYPFLGVAKPPEYIIRTNYKNREK